MKFLMCPPTYYRVEYILNPWMAPSEWTQANYVQAQHQWGNLVELLKSLGAEIELATPDRKYPDMVFTANAGHVYNPEKHDDRPLILSNFRHPERQGEEEFFRRWGGKNGYMRCLEGAGDLLWDRFRKRYWGGYGFRSDEKAVRSFTYSDFESNGPYTLKLVDPRFYHLDTAFCPLTDGEVMYWPGAFSSEAIDKIDKGILPKYRIMITEEEAKMFCANAIVIDHKIIMSQCTSSLKDKLAHYSYEVIECNLSQFHKAGGSAACLTLRLNYG